MHQEERNNLLQQKLDGMTTLPAGVDFNAFNAWQKLERELSPGPKGRRERSPGPKGRRENYSVKYFAVAAVFVGLIASIWFLNAGKRSEVVAKKDRNKQDALKGNSTAVTEILADTSSSIKTLKGEIAKRVAKQNIKLEKGEAAKDKLATISTPLVEELQTANYKLQTDNVTQNKDWPVEQLQTINNKLQTTAVAPTREFRIVHINETLPPKVDIARNHTSPNTGFPFYKQPSLTDNADQILPDATEQPPRKKEWGLMKTLTNSIKD